MESRCLSECVIANTSNTEDSVQELAPARPALGGGKWNWGAISAAVLVAVMLSSVSPEADTIDGGQDGPRTETGYAVSSEVQHHGTGSKLIAESSGQIGQSTGAGTQIDSRPGALEHDWSVLLGPLTSSPESRELAARLEAQLLAKKSGSAERLLVSAVEVGTLASLMLDRLGDPGLATFLQNLRLVRQEQAAAGLKTAVDNPVAGASEGPDQAFEMTNAASDSSQAQEMALRQAHMQAGSLAQDLAAARQELAAANQRVAQVEALVAEDKRTVEARALEHKAALERERARADALAQALAEARKTNESAPQRSARLYETADESDTAHVRVTEQRAALMSSALAQHRARAETLAHELTAARQELEYARALKPMLDQERSRSDELARDLASALRELEAVKSGHPTPPESRNDNKALLLRAFEQMRTWRQEQSPMPRKEQPTSDVSRSDPQD
jgi:hypothetical protein